MRTSFGLGLVAACLAVAGCCGGPQRHETQPVRGSPVPDDTSASSGRGVNHAADVPRSEGC